MTDTAVVENLNKAVDFVGRILVILFRSDDNDYCVCKVAPKKGLSCKTITCTGCVVNPTKGEDYHFTGNIVINPKYGEQVKLSTAELIVPDTIEGITAYFKNGNVKGVGAKTAEKLISAFGTSTLDVIVNEPEKLETVVSKKLAKRIHDMMVQNEIETKAKMFLSQFGITSRMIEKIVEQFHEKSISVFKKNPYLLTEVSGIGFEKADSYALKSGIKQDDPNRLKFGAFYTMQEINKVGDCGYPVDKFLQNMSSTLHADVALCESTLYGILDNPNDSRLVKTTVENTEMVFDGKLYNSEIRIAKRLIELRDAKPFYSAPTNDEDIDNAIQIMKNYRHDNIDLSPSQRAAVKNGLKNNVCVITGGPGVGKTTIIKTIISLLDDGMNKISLAAPTGRAAKRMSQATGRDASTIHRLLETTVGDNGMFFKRNADNPLEGSVFIIDESSMIDTSLMDSLLRAIPNGAKLLIIGDVDQLPSVGAGQVLKDIIDSHVIPVSRLTEIYRQAAGSNIISNAHRVNDGIMPDLSNKKGTDFFYINSDDPQKTVDFILAILEKNIKNLRNENGKPFDPMRDVQVLCPMHSSMIGTDTMNRFLQDALNKKMHDYHIYREIRDRIDHGNSITKEESKFYNSYNYDIPVVELRSREFTIGDKVMQMRNDYDKNVFNGDIGYINNIDVPNKKVYVKFEDTEANMLVEYKYHELGELALSYACTIHKSQGSEYPVVIIPVMNQNYIMLKRKLLYTGITRGKNYVILIGQKQSIFMATKGREDDFFRNTKLCHWLKQGDKDPSDLSHYLCQRTRIREIVFSRNN